MAELKTEPAFSLARSKRPWWAHALLGGIGAGAAIAAALLGLASGPVRGEPPVHTSGIAGVQSDAEWRAHIDAKLTELGERLARIEGRLDRR